MPGDVRCLEELPAGGDNHCKAPEEETHFMSLRNQRIRREEEPAKDQEDRAIRWGRCRHKLSGCNRDL